MTPVAASVYLLIVLAVMYWIPIRLWYTRWGVTDAELARPMPGDGTFPDPNYETMLGGDDQSDARNTSGRG